MRIGFGVLETLEGTSKILVALGDEAIARMRKGFYIAGVIGDVDLKLSELGTFVVSLPDETDRFTGLVVMDGEEKGKDQWLNFEHKT